MQYKINEEIYCTSDINYKAIKFVIEIVLFRRLKKNS